MSEPAASAASRDEVTLWPPETPVLLAALEAMAALIYREYGEGPIAPEVRIHTSATPEQVQAVNEVERYWEAAGVTISDEWW